MGPKCRVEVFHFPADHVPWVLPKGRGGSPRPGAVPGEPGWFPTRAPPGVTPRGGETRAQEEARQAGRSWERPLRTASALSPPGRFPWKMVSQALVLSPLSGGPQPIAEQVSALLAGVQPVLPASAGHRAPGTGHRPCGRTWDLLGCRFSGGGFLIAGAVLLPWDGHIQCIGEVFTVGEVPGSEQGMGWPGRGNLPPPAPHPTLPRSLVPRLPLCIFFSH